MKQGEVYIDRLKENMPVQLPETLEEATKLLEIQWMKFSDMLAENAPFYYFIHTIISTVRDLDKGFMKVVGSKVCMLPLIRTALENTLICYGAYILRDSTKLDTFTKRYLDGRKISAITVSLSPDDYNKIIKHPDKPDVTTSTEIELTNANLTKLMDVSYSGIRNIYLECCGNIHPTKEQIQYYIKSIGYIGDKDQYTEAELSQKDIDKYTGWMLDVNSALLALTEIWLWCYHHIPFNEETNGTKEIYQMVGEEIPIENTIVSINPEAFLKLLDNATGSDEIKKGLRDGLEKQINKLRNGSDTDCSKNVTN